jgi:hypothetical protein
MIQERNGFGDNAFASLNTSVASKDNVGLEGYYHVVCRDKDGKLKWEEYVENQVVQAGKNLMFTQLLGTSIAVVGPYLGIIGVTGTSVSAGSFVVGATYSITSVGTTSFTSIGASANTVGVVFTATGVGTGTGTATLIGTFSPTDTMASHAGWTEFTAYTVGGSAVRGTAVFSVANGGQTTPGTNVVTASATSITYTITGVGGNVGGCFLVTGTGAVNTQSSTAGTLYSAGAFSSIKSTTAGDTVAVTYSTTATS